MPKKRGFRGYKVLNVENVGAGNETRISDMKSENSDFGFIGFVSRCQKFNIGQNSIAFFQYIFQNKL